MSCMSHGITRYEIICNTCLVKMLFRHMSTLPDNTSLVSADLHFNVTYLYWHHCLWRQVTICVSNKKSSA
jgi:hypothetical protein